MNKKSKKRIRAVISTILSFLLALIFTAGSAVVGVYVGFLNEDRIIDCLNYKDYYSGVEDTFYQNAKDITIPVGLPEEVVTGIVDSNKIHADVKNYVVAAINGKNFQFDTQSLQEQLGQNVRGVFAAEGAVMTQEQEDTIPAYTQMIADEYVKAATVPFVGYFAQIKEKVQKVVWIALALCIILSLIIIVMLIQMQHWKHRGIRYIIYSALASMLMVGLPGAAALISGFYKHINISSEYVYHAVTKYISNGLWVFVYLAIGWLAVSVCLLFLIRYLKNSSR